MYVIQLLDTQCVTITQEYTGAHIVIIVRVHKCNKKDLLLINMQHQTPSEGTSSRLPSKCNDEISSDSFMSSLLPDSQLLMEAVGGLAEHSILRAGSTLM